MTVDQDQTQTTHADAETSDDAGQPEVESYSAQAVERPRRFIAADESHVQRSRAEQKHETGQRGAREPDEASPDPTAGV